MADIHMDISRAADYSAVFSKFIGNYSFANCKIVIAVSYATEFLKADLKKAEKAVNTLPQINSMKQCQYDAVVSLVYNVGTNPVKDSDNDLYKALNDSCFLSFKIYNFILLANASISSASTSLKGYRSSKVLPILYERTKVYSVSIPSFKFL